MRKRILSFDVGIKNLAFCMIEMDTESWNILDWGVVDLRQTEEGREYPPVCAALNGKGKACTRPVAFYRRKEGEVQEG